MEKHEFSKEIIDYYLYGFKEIRLVSSEEVLNTLQKDIHRVGTLPLSPPLSPRKIRTPDEISLCTSSVPGVGFGACAIKKIPQSTWYGPFEGKLVRTTEVTKSVRNEYMWEIFHDGEVSHYLDGFNENNWMSFVRCARHKKEQNLVVFQYHGCIYYRCTKDILPGQELLVWYDAKYTQLLGIPLAWNDNRSSGSKRKTSQTNEEASKKRKNNSPVMLLQKSERQSLIKPQPPPQQQSKRPTGDINTLIDVSKKLQEQTPDTLLSPTIPYSSLAAYDLQNRGHYLNYERPLQRLSLTAAAMEREPRLRLPSLENFQLNVPYADPMYYYKNYYNLRNFPSPPLDTVKFVSSGPHKGPSIPIKNF